MSDTNTCAGGEGIGTEADSSGEDFPRPSEDVSGPGSAGLRYRKQQTCHNGWGNAGCPLMTLVLTFAQLTCADIE